MSKRTTWTLAIMAASITLFTSCATRQAISTSDELLPVLDSITVGQTGWVDVVGVLKPYSGSSPKGAGLTELSIGSRSILVHSFAMHKDVEDAHLNKTVSARAKITYFPLPGEPSSQLQGHWITEVKDLKIME